MTSLNDLLRYGMIEERYCVNPKCKKVFYRATKARKHMFRIPNIRGKSYVTCSKKCSSVYGQFVIKNYNVQSNT